jgi:hypothetical protein
MTTEQRLRECPFCGGKAYIWQNHTVACTSCDAEVNRGEVTLEENIAAWNRRAPSQAQDTCAHRLIAARKLVGRETIGCFKCVECEQIFDAVNTDAPWPAPDKEVIVQAQDTPSLPEAGGNKIDEYLNSLPSIPVPTAVPSERGDK